MSRWREQEWRCPRSREIVIDQEGNIGEVLRTRSGFPDRKLDIADDRGTEVWTDEIATTWWVINDERALDFRKRRMAHLGFREGGVCCISGDLSLPFRIEAMDTNGFSNLPVFYLRDLRQFSPEIRTTTGLDLVYSPDIEFPPIESIFSPTDSGLKYRIEVSLVEKEREGWAPVGSPWEFFRMEDAVSEIQSWKCRLKARRIASAVGMGWKPSFPCWTVETDGENLRVVHVQTSAGTPALFPTAYHAAVGMDMMSHSEWISALSGSQDILEL